MDRFMHHRKRILVSRRRRYAKKAGVEFTITAADLVWPTVCPILGLEIDYTTLGKCFPNSPSLDKVDPRQGYVPGNVAVISHRANSMKSNLDLDQLERLVAYIKAHV